MRHCESEFEPNAFSHTGMFSVDVEPVQNMMVYTQEAHEEIDEQPGAHYS
jgi:hypothetical protein